jgi:hypothetical protein
MYPTISTSVMGLPMAASSEEKPYILVKQSGMVMSCFFVLYIESNGEVLDLRPRCRGEHVGDDALDIGGGLKPNNMGKDERIVCRT